MTELYPPFVGGSAVLFEGIYSRLDNCEVAVLTDQQRSPGPLVGSGGLRIERRSISCDYWGLRRPSAFSHHWRVASEAKKLSSPGGVLHCGRTLPEGLAGLMANLRGGPEFACWAHGEDLTMQLTQSREMTLLTRLICRRARQLFANSKYTAGLLESLGTPRKKLCVIHPGVDTQRFRPEIDGSSIRERFLPADGKLLLSVGRLVRRKGFDLTLRAMSLLRTSHPNLRYVLVGDGPDKSRLAALIQDLGLEDSARLVGKTSDDDLPMYYAACDLFVHPNRIDGVDVEGFGIVFLEAAAVGRPAVGGRSGGVPEAIEEGETGLLVGGDDAEELAVVLKMLLGSPERRHSMGELARRRVLKSFTWEAAAEKLSQVLLPTQAGSGSGL